VRAYPDSEIQRIPKGVRSSYEKENITYKAINDAREELFKKLEAILDKYKPYLSYNAPFKAGPAFFDTSRRESGYDFYITGALIDFSGKPNNPPVTDVGTYPDKRLPCAYQLKPVQAYDADNDPISYRWVITHIPEGEVQSLDYVLYQKLSDSQVATLKPDIVGNDPANAWQVSLELNDGKDEGVAVSKRRPAPIIATAGLTKTSANSALKPAQAATTPGTLTAKLNPNRHILWIQQNDDDTTLSKMGADGKQYTYYLEVAKVIIGIYRNFDDNWKPLDLDRAYRAPLLKMNGIERGVSFLINASSITAPGAFDGQSGGIITGKPEIAISISIPSGGYDGLGGSSSTEIITGKSDPPIGVIDIYQEVRSDANPYILYFYSAADRGNSIALQIGVDDGAISYLVLSTPDCSYGRLIEKPSQKLQPEKLFINQWIDKEIWFNQNGQLKVVQRKDLASDRRGWVNSLINSLLFAHASPDWMERIAAESLFGLPQEQYVQRILPKNFSNSHQLGEYKPGTKDIYLSPYAGGMRYNSPFNNIYGFSAKYGCASAAVHEATHSLIAWIKLQDLDKDGLFGATGPFAIIKPGMVIEYMLDSGANLYGPYGPELTNHNSYIYLGDRKPDIEGRVRYFIKKLNFDIANLNLRENPAIPADIPIDPARSTVGGLYITFRNTGGSIVFIEGVHFSYSFLLTKTKNPKLSITILNRGRWRKDLDALQKRGYILGDLYVPYTIAHPHQIEEYESGRLQDSSDNYTGDWKHYHAE